MVSFSQHISSPLMEFERLKLLREYKTDPPKPTGEDGTEQPPPTPVPAEGEEPPIFVDYM